METPQPVSNLVQPPAKPASAVPSVKANPPAQKTHPVKRPKPAGWFSYSDKGLRAAVVANIKKSTDLPDGFKRSLLEDIQGMDAAFNFFVLDCHRHLQGGKMVTHITINAQTVAAS